MHCNNFIIKYLNLCSLLYPAYAFYAYICMLKVARNKPGHSPGTSVLWSLVVIDRYLFFITDTDYLYVYVPDNRYVFTVIK